MILAILPPKGMKWCDKCNGRGWLHDPDNDGFKRCIKCEGYMTVRKEKIK